MSRPYVPQRSGRYEYAGDAIEAVEATSCSRGCIHAINPEIDAPGGGCDVLMAFYTAEYEPSEHVVDHGDRLVCTRREAPPPRERQHEPRAEDPDTIPLFDELTS